MVLSPKCIFRSQSLGEATHQNLSSSIYHCPANAVIRLFPVIVVTLHIMMSRCLHQVCTSCIMIKFNFKLGWLQADCKMNCNYTSLNIYFFFWQMERLLSICQETPTLSLLPNIHSLFVVTLFSSASCTVAGQRSWLRRPMSWQTCQLFSFTLHSFVLSDVSLQRHPE